MNAGDAWERGLGRWEMYFALVLVSTVIYTLSGSGWPRGAIGSALLFAMVPWYLLFGRRAISEGHQQGLIPYVYVAGVIVLSGAAATVTPNSSLVLFALCPQCFMVLNWAPALVAVILLNLVPATWILWQNLGRGYVLSFTLWSVVVIAFSAFFGRWVDRIILQSAERRDLIERLEATQAELAEVSREAGVMAERERMAAEIHDTLAQGFTSILMLLQAAETSIGRDAGKARRQVGLAVRTARENLAEARALVAAVPPAALGGSSLEEALRRLTGRLGEELDVDTACVVSGEPRRLAARLEVVLLRAAQEGLANVRKHAKAGCVALDLTYEPTTVRLAIRDDGVGFAPDAAHGFGLKGMRDRVRQVGGTLDISSAPGAGTSVAVEVPTN